MTLFSIIGVQRISVGGIHPAGTAPFVSQGLQKRDIDACVMMDFKVNTAKFPKTVLTLTKLEKGKAVFIGSLMCSVTKQQLEGVG